MGRFGIISLGLAALLLAATAQAGDGQLSDPQILINTNAQEIVAQQQEIRAEADAGRGRYEDMDPATMQELRGHQDLVLGLLEGQERSTDLPEDSQMELFNSLEAISGILNKAEDERMICRRERTVGSRMATRVCRTVAQRRAEQQDARDAMIDRGTMCTNCGTDSSWRGGSN